MREIKFRGKRKDNGEDVKYISICLANGTSVGVDPETVGQYTGLKDSKRTQEFPEGQEIYEGIYA
ncbi:hypothetical protein [Paenibacillus medicaginis]|uniref:Transposase n=1 Tax=Paenibacillus medicaginis TaxID=1470560 RepID=A0ABV5BUJ6_9BACL